MLTHTPWQAVPGLYHGFLGRAECAGTEVWDTVVARAGAALPVATARQVHGIRVVAADIDGESVEADALVGSRAGRLVGVVTADCVPILLVDRRRRLAAAVHAGWRGAAAGVVEAALAELDGVHGAPAREVEAAIGPAVGGCCYEVGEEVLTAFEARTGEATVSAWATRGDRRFVDLRQATSLLLARAGVERVTVLGPCTACGSGYHSYRRDGRGAGRQLSFVGWA
jgi:YfiH family protein